MSDKERGLEGWIKETRGERLRSDDPSAGDLGGREKGVDNLARHVGRLVDVLAEKLELLRQLEDDVSDERHEELDEKLETLAAVSRSWRSLPPATHGESPPPEPEVHEPGAVVRLTPETFGSEISSAETPVLLSLRLEGHESCQRAEEAMLAIRRGYPGELKLCSADIMATDPKAMPQMLKLGREFISNNVPALQLYWRGRRVRESTGEIDVERWVREIGSEVERESGDDGW